MGKYFTNERNREEIRQELLRLRARWNRVVELKEKEACLHILHICPTSATISFSLEEYAYHIKVIGISIFILLEGSVVVLIFWFLLLQCVDLP